MQIAPNNKGKNRRCGAEAGRSDRKGSVRRFWERPGLSRRDRSLITVTALIAMNPTEQLPFHLRRALENGVTRDELVELITHLAFYSGWPTAMSAIRLAKEAFQGNEIQSLNIQLSVMVHPGWPVEQASACGTYPWFENPQAEACTTYPPSAITSSFRVPSRRAPFSVTKTESPN